MIFSYFEKRLKRDSSMMCRDIYKKQNMNLRPQQERVNPFVFRNPFQTCTPTRSQVMKHPRNEINEKRQDSTPPVPETETEPEPAHKRICHGCLGQKRYACLYCSHGCSICKNTNYVDCKICGGVGKI